MRRSLNKRGSVIFSGRGKAQPAGIRRQRKGDRREEPTGKSPAFLERHRDSCAIGGRSPVRGSPTTDGSKNGTKGKKARRTKKVPEKRGGRPYIDNPTRSRANENVRGTQKTVAKRRTPAKNAKV